MRNDTTAMTAKRARKSPNRLTTCAYQTRRSTSIRSTSRKVIGTGGAVAAGVAMAIHYTLALATTSSSSR